MFGVATGTMDGHPFAVTASADDTAQVWNLETGALAATFRGHIGDVFTVATAVMDGQSLGVSGGSDHKVRVWDLRSGQEITSFSGHTAQVACLAVGRVKGRAVSRLRRVRWNHPCLGPAHRQADRRPVEISRRARLLGGDRRGRRGVLAGRGRLQGKRHRMESRPGLPLER